MALRKDIGPLEKVVSGTEKANSLLTIIAGLDEDPSIEQFINLFWQLRYINLRDANSQLWNTDGLNKVWQSFISKNYDTDDRLGMIAALLKTDQISPDILRYLKTKKLLMLDDKVKVEPHVPLTTTGEWKGDGSWLVCDDYLPYIINSPSGNPFKDIQDGTYKLKLDKFTPLLQDQDFPQGRLGMVSVNDKIHILYANTPVVGTTPESRGVILPGVYYATNPKNPLHVAWTQGLDYNLSGIIHEFQKYQFTGISRNMP